MPEIVVHDLLHISVDGLAAGDIVSLIANTKLSKDPIPYGDILAALQTWRDGLHEAHNSQCEGLCAQHEAALAASEAATNQALADSDASHARAIAEREEATAAAIEQLKKAHDKLMAKKDAELDNRRETIESLSAQIDALSDTELAQQLKREAACQAAHDQITPAQAVLAAHAESGATNA